MQKLASAKNKKAVNIFLLLSGLVFILIVKCIEHFQMVLFFEGAIIDYYTYIVYKNCVLFGLLISGVGVLLFLTNKITRLIFLLVYVLGIITIVITKNIRIPAENYKLFDISFNRKYTDKELIAYLEKNGFSKTPRKSETDEYGNPQKSYYYPYNFIKTDSSNFLTHLVSFEYDSLDYEGKETKRTFINSIIISIYYEKTNMSHVDYSKLKSVFDSYYCRYKAEYQSTPEVSYPSFRTFSFGSYGKGSSLSISKKEDMINFNWDSNFNRTHLQFDGDAYQPLSNLVHDNAVINVKEEDMFITIFQSINY